MPFLLPALASLFSDSMVLYLHHLDLYAAQVATAATMQQNGDIHDSNHSIYSENNNNDDDDGSASLAVFYYRVGYLPFLAGLRIALLMLPLFFHSYTGTALKCTTFYRVLYSTSLLVLLFQMLALAIMDPKSLQALVIMGDGQDQQQGGGNNPQLLQQQQQQLHELRRIWYMLLFSTMSNICHVVLFWHVRSTAQSPHYASSFYFAIRSSSSTAAAAHRASPATSTSSIGLYGNHVAAGGDVVHAVNEFVVDLRVRLQRAKKEWTKRLEDYGSGGNSSNSSNNNNNPLKNHPLTPFRVLLSLFAYEDVLQNGKLEAVYQMDGGQSMTFYIPQLLSFLLHGAGDSLQSSSALEEWILQKCRTNVYFAHKCFWFLRAWCLEQVLVMPLPPQGDATPLDTAAASGGATAAASTQYSSLSSLCYSTPGNRNNNHKTANNNNNSGLFLSSNRNNSDSILHASQQNNNKMQQSSLSSSPPPPPPPYLDQPAPSPTSTDTWDDEFDGGGGNGIPGTTSTSTALMTTTQRLTRCPSPLPPISSMTAVSGTSMLSAAVLATPSSTLRTTASSILSTTLHDCLASPQTGGGGGGLRRSIMASTSNSNLCAITADKFLPEERAMIERLMLRVKECGQESAHLLKYGADHSSRSHHTTTHSHSDIMNNNPSKYRASNSAGTSTSHCSSSNEDEDEDSYVTATQPDYDTTDDEYEDLMIPVPCHDNNNICKLSAASSTSPTSLFGKVQTTAIAAGQIPIHPMTQKPSQRHLACLAAGQRKYGFLPWLEAMEGRRGQQPRRRIGRETQDFDQTPRFLDSLLNMAEALFRVPREQRKTELGRHLRILECEFLPSNAIYLPISQKVHHTVWRIVPEESIPLSTKERVPCLLALEVINHDAVAEYSTRAGHGDDNAWRSILVHISHHRYNNDTKPPTSPLSSRGAATSARSKRSPPMEHGGLSSSWSPQKSFQHMVSASMDASVGAAGGGGAVAGNNNSNNKSNTEVVGMSEADVVNQWRFKVRHPMRHVSLIDKVTVGLDKVLRTTSGGVATAAAAAARGTGTLQRSTSDELQNLLSAKNGERLAQHEEKPAAATTSRLTTISLSFDSFMKDPEQGKQIISDDEGILQMEEQQHGLSLANLSRASSFGSSVSMGQWGTPQPTPDANTRQHQHQPPINRLMIPPHSPPPFNMDRRSSGGFNGGIGQQNVRRRLDRESDEQRNGGSNSLAYGSDHEDDLGEDDLLQHDWHSNSGVRGRSSSINDTHERPLSPVTARRKHNKPPPVVFRESWSNKEERVRQKSIYGEHPGWKLLPILVKAQDDLRQEQLASQLIYRMASILANENVPVWLCPYEIIALTDSGGIIEAIPDTISLDSLKRNDPNFTSLRDFFHSHYGDGTEELADAKSNFVESLAAYSIVCFLLQIKDRHNGNILLDSRGHLIHIDFGFFFLSSPGKNVGFESAPFKLTRDFVSLLGGPNGHLFRVFRELCVKTFIALRKHCMEIILLVEMLKNGNEKLQCFRGRPDDAIQQLRERFRLDLNDRACREYVNALVDDSIENWRTNWYDRYQRYFVGVL